MECMTPALLQQRLQETKSWCASRVQIRADHDLRSSELKPEVIKKSNESEYSFLLFGTAEQNEETINRLIEKRVALLASQSYSQEINKGQVLLFDPGQSLFDGAAEAATNGFFDDNNVPPWDTWICYVRDEEARYGNYLLSWVPSHLVDLAEDGIQVNPEQCICWAKDLGTSFLRHPDVYPSLKVSNTNTTRRCTRPPTACALVVPPVAPASGGG